MTFFRPEAVDQLRRYGVPAVLTVVGGLLIWAGVGQLRRGDLIGLLFIVIGLFALLALFGAVERALLARFGLRRGPGVVEIEEGRITYLAPEGGGVVAIDALARVEILTTDEGPGSDDLFWVFTDLVGGVLIVPGGARNAPAMLDALESLSGVDHKAVFEASVSTVPGRFKVYQRADLAASEGRGVNLDGPPQRHGSGP